MTNSGFGRNVETQCIASLQTRLFSNTNSSENMNDKQINNLENLISEYKRMMQGQVDLERLTRFAITYHSTAIEGSTLTEGQVYNLLDLIFLRKINRLANSKW